MKAGAITAAACGALLAGGAGAAECEARAPAAESRRLWLAEAAGENLALGRPARYSVPPDYDLTRADGSDTRDLTDGRLSAREDERIWFDSAAVGWYEAGRPAEGVNILIDLGAVQPVGKVVARFLGGGEQNNLLFPAECTVVVSEDGQDFHRAASLCKLLPPERDRAGEPGLYYLEEKGTAYVHPFVFPVKVRARYIGLAVRAATDSLFCDEIAVIKGAFRAEDAPAPDRAQCVSFVTEGVIFGPSKPVLAISTNVVTPNFFRLLDGRPAAERSPEARCVIELPAAVTILATEASRDIAVESFAAGGAPWRRWRLPLPAREVPNRELSCMPFYLTVEGRLPPEPHAVFYAESKGFAPNRMTVPVRTIAIPKAPRLDGFHVSLAWMSEREAVGWPGFLDAWEQLGFTAVGTFPYWWTASDVAPFVDRFKAWLREARQRGFQVLQNDSPFHMMVNAHRNEPEIYSQLAGGPSKNPCPAYRGRFYREEIARVGDCFEKTQPDFVFYDIELWRPGASEASSCARCRAWQQQSRKPMDACLVDMGTEMLQDMDGEIRARGAKLGRRMPVVAMYDLRASEPAYQLVHSFSNVFPRVIQRSQPSLYCLNRLGYAHDSMRADLKALGGKGGLIVPWITAGTYGEADSSAIEALVLECFLNGAGGIAYFQFATFDTPLDFQAHARALAALAPHQTLLREGRPCEVPAAAELGRPRPPGWRFWRRPPPAAPAEGVLVSAWWNGRDEMLLLLGNYDDSRPVTVRPALPFAGLDAATDARDGRTLRARLPLAVDVPGKGFRLLHLRGRLAAQETARIEKTRGRK
jgi:hypothetical protein